jgi:hypothetical protein
MQIKEYTNINLTQLPKNAIFVLLEVIYELWKQWINCWISAWTVLWLHRDWKLIEWDTDLDIWVLWWQTINPPNDWELIRTIDTNRPMQKAYKVKWVIVDFYYYYENWEYLETETDHWIIRKTKSYINWLIPKVPEYLEERYWDWQTPKLSKTPRTDYTNNLIK